MLKDSDWKVYYPDDGETADDAYPIQIYEWRNRIIDEDDAAEAACRMDHDQRDGWERKGKSFIMVLIDPSGKEIRYEGWHEPSVEHRYQSMEEDDDE